ncbi:MAG: hypothetical protein IT545_14580 [Rhodobacteraceae bacterium]|nr:hypothetical protein [Paracoccaceae bacterium]
MRSLLTAAAVAVALGPAAATADAIADSIRAALEAYEAGDLQYALEELVTAQGLITALKTEALAAYLPAAPEGWTREVNSDYGQSLALFGGGSGVEARYDGGATSFTLSIVADSPLLASFAPVFANPAMMAAMGSVTRVGRHRVLDQGGQLVAVVGNRVLIQASGAEAATMLPFIAAMDLDGLAAFDP